MVGSPQTGIIVAASTRAAGTPALQPGAAAPIHLEGSLARRLALPLVRRRETGCIPLGIAISLVAIVAIWPWAILWGCLPGR